jgi:hypothetical protein
MFYHQQKDSPKVRKRILRHKRTRHHNDAALFNESSYSTSRKRTKSLIKRTLLKNLNIDD